MNVRIFDHKVDDFIKSLEYSTGTRVSHHINLLEQFGNLLRIPYSKSLGNKLFELRVRGKQEIRIFYTFNRNQAILLHGFIKKTQTTPKKEIEIATSKKKSLTIV